MISSLIDSSSECIDLNNKTKTINKPKAFQTTGTNSQSFS